jgi:hypothetical protein
MDSAIHADDKTIVVLYKNIKFITKFFQPALTNYGHNIEDLEDDYMKIIEKDDGTDVSEEYLDLTRAFSYLNALKYVMSRVNEIISIMDNNKYEKYMRGKISDGAINEAIVVVRDTKLEYNRVRDHVNLYRHSFYESVWRFIFNHWRINDIINELELAYRKYPYTIDLMGYCLGKLHEQIIYARDDDQNWREYYQRLINWITLMRYSALDVPDLDKYKIPFHLFAAHQNEEDVAARQRGREILSERDKVVKELIVGQLISAGAIVRDLTDMPFMNNLSPTYEFTTDIDTASSIVIKREHGQKMRYTIKSLFDNDGITPFDGLKETVVKKYTTIAPSENLVVGSADINLMLKDLINAHYKEPEPRLKVYETYGDGEYHELKIPSGGRDPDHLLGAPILTDRYNKKIAEVIESRCMLNIREEDIKQLINTELRDQNEIEWLINKTKEFCAELWKTKKRGGELLDFLNQIADMVIGFIVGARGKGDDVTCNRLLWRQRELRSIYMKKLYPIYARLTVGTSSPGEEHYTLIMNQMLLELSREPTFEDSKKTAIELAYELYSFNAG